MYDRYGGGECAGGGWLVDWLKIGAGPGFESALGRGGVNVVDGVPDDAGVSTTSLASSLSLHILHYIDHKLEIALSWSMNHILSSHLICMKQALYHRHDPKNARGTLRV